MRQIEWIEAPRVSVNGVDRFPGDVTSEPDEDAAAYIGAGWAKCVKTGECGERVAGVGVQLQVNNAVTDPAVR